MEKLSKEEIRKRKAEYAREWYNANKLEIIKKVKERYNTPYGRALQLRTTYIKNDRTYSRIDNEIPKNYVEPKWIVENIFSKPCAHCGKTGWEVIGCNRLDNSKPHTMDNVEPCCMECNSKLASEYFRTRYSKKVYQYSLDGKLVKVWDSVADTSKNGFNHGAVAACCRGGYKHRGKWINISQHKGYRWSYTPL